LLHITPSERIALELLAAGVATNELASRLGLNTCEIDAHLASLFARMGAASQTEAVAFAMRRGLLSTGSQMISLGGDSAPVRDAQAMTDLVTET
jgi:DNA-binding CsgD family transcriptional regulator